jgi:hypothetical protein
MRNILLIALLIISVSVFSQRKSYVEIKDSLTAFTIPVSKGTLIIDTTSKKAWINKQVISVGDSLDEISKYQIAGAGLDTNYWRKNGNGATDTTVNFVGTKDSKGLVFRTNNTRRGGINATNGYWNISTRLGIGTAAPTSKLDVLDGGLTTTGTGGTGNITMGWTNVLGGFLWSNTNYDGASVQNAVGARWSPNANGHLFYTSAATAVGATRAWTERWRIDPTNGYLSSSGEAGTAMISLIGTSSNTLRNERNTTANTAGNTLSIYGGGATSGSNNKNSGGITLNSGEKTGVYSNSSIKIQTQGSNAASTADNVSYDRAVFMSTENLFDNTLDTLFRVTLGADSMFTGTLNYNVMVVDGDSNQVEKGYVELIYIRNGSTGLTAVTPVMTQVLELGTLTTTFSYIYNVASGYVYVCVNANSTTHQALTTVGNIMFNGALIGMGGRFTAFTEF